MSFGLGQKVLLHAVVKVRTRRAIRQHERIDDGELTSCDEFGEAIRRTVLGCTASPSQSRLRFDSSARDPSPPAPVSFIFAKSRPSRQTQRQTRGTLSALHLCSSQTVTCQDSGCLPPALSLRMMKGICFNNIGLEPEHRPLITRSSETNFCSEAARMPCSSIGPVSCTT